MESLRDKAEADLVQAEKAPEGQRHVHMAEHMKMLGEIMSQLHQDHPTHQCRLSSTSPGWKSTTKWLMTF
jgi:hypothetical protein